MANINQIGTIIYLKLIPTGFITGDQNFHLILIISNKYVEFDRHLFISKPQVLELMLSLTQFYQYRPFFTIKV